MCWSADKMCWSANKICWSTDYMCWSTKLIICVDLLTRCVDQLIRCVDQLISCGDQLTKRTVYISHLSQYSWLTRPAWGSRRYPGLWSADSRCQSRPRIDHRSARPRGTFAQRPNSTRRRKFQKVLSVEHWVMNLYRVKSIPPAPFVFKFEDIWRSPEPLSAVLGTKVL